MATAGGLEKDSVEAVVLAVTELATNLLRYAAGGRLTVEPAAKQGRTGVRIESLDSGPGLGNIERALSAGFSGGSGWGDGLAIVRHVTDSLEVDSGPAGTRIVGYKWRHSQPS